MIASLKDARKVLFVCSGNCCRSPMAALLFREKLRKNGLDSIQSESAGLVAPAGAPPPEEVVKVMERAGVDAREHRARLLSKELVEWADLILVMDTGHQTQTALRFPSAVGKTYLLKTFAGAAGRREIEDPIGKSMKDFEACAAEIGSALDGLLEKFKKAASGGTP